MRLPHYLAPEPPFDFEAHGFDFPLRAKNMHSLDWYVECRCGTGSPISDSVVLASGRPFEAFERWMEKHIDEEMAKARMLAKWGGRP